MAAIVEAGMAKTLTCLGCGWEIPLPASEYAVSKACREHWETCPKK